ncbi:CBS domain-containing protein [Phenylobacterium sp. LjRoot225]|uniref:CBS domain-containing protein n=1 Tax=Phenylobacterium sp. LjRoot225 TaxID=3342285 RepID=UPI003ECC43A1
MRVAELMTRNPQPVSPEDTLQHAAALMEELNVGALPVCREDRLVGMITDRDITVRASAAGQPPDVATVADAMTEGVRYVYEDDELEDAEAVMQEVQVRRLPVITHAGRLVGIISLGDIATSAESGVRETLEDISRPSKPAH